LTPRRRHGTSRPEEGHCSDHPARLDPSPWNRKAIWQPSPGRCARCPDTSPDTAHIDLLTRRFGLRMAPKNFCRVRVDVQLRVRASGRWWHPWTSQSQARGAIRAGQRLRGGVPHLRRCGRVVGHRAGGRQRGVAGLEPDERALNSVQLLSFLKTTAHITGKPRYETEYKKLAWDFKYADWITRLNEFRQEMNYSDEELGMLPYYCVFQYEKDPALLKAYRSGVDEWWKNIQREANPLWTFIYLTGQPEADIDLPAAVWTLYRMPMDTIEWTVRNSHRADIQWATSPDRFGEREALTLLPPDERRVMKWNSNPFVVDGGGNGHGEDDGAAFLLPYWMGRYHRFIVGE